MKIFGAHRLQLAWIALILATAVSEVQAGRLVDPLFRSGMEVSACANGVIEDAEQCDGANLAGSTCASIGLVAGTLACTGACRFDLSACISNLPPSAVDDVAAFNEDQAPVQFSAAMLTANDVDADGDTLALVAVSNALHGSVSLLVQSAQFMVDPNFNGIAGFDYTLSDGELTDTAHVTISVIAVNDPPFAQATAASTNQDQSVVVNLSGSDIENSALTFWISISPAHGQLGSIQATGPMTATVSYTPQPGFFGSDSFMFRANDGGLNSGAAFGSLTVVRVICGDGLIRGVEECDDGSNANGDGCSALCLIESGFSCSGEPSVCIPF